MATRKAELVELHLRKFRLLAMMNPSQANYSVLKKLMDKTMELMTMFVRYFVMLQ